MKYDVNSVYHIYNRGINRERIFFEDRNYHYFLGKMRKHLKPYAHILAYCLMPNHFHWLIQPTLAGVAGSDGRIPVWGRELGAELLTVQQLSKGIGVLLSSYTQGVNKAQKRTGSLFQQNTPNANCFTFDGNLWLPNNLPHEQSHPINCFHYIHDNPVKGGLVEAPENWPYSSAVDYAGWRDDDLCSYRVTESLLNIHRSSLRF